MKIVDCDVHLSAERGPGNITAEQLIDEMVKTGTDKAICWPMLTYTREVIQDNTAISKAAERYPDRIIPFGGLNPMLGMTKTMEELKRSCDELGLIGFKLNAARDGYYIDDPELAFPVYEEIASRGKFLALHTGLDPSRAHPWRFKSIAKAFPDTRIIMVHMGGAGTSLYSEAIEVAGECPNVVVAPSEADPKAIIQAIKTLGASKMCYASDAPFSLMKVTLAVFNAILTEFTEEEASQVMGESILRFLNIE